MPEMGRQFGIFRPKVLPQPLADATAYRSACGAINLFAAFVDSVHRGFRFALIALTAWYQVIRAGIVSPADRLHAFRVKLNEQGNRFQVPSNRANSPAAHRGRSYQGWNAVPISNSG